jgi:hypothetical protein
MIQHAPDIGGFFMLSVFDMARQEPTLTDTPADGDELKAYPNGIKVFAQALWQFWPHISGLTTKKRLTIREFKEISGFERLAEQLALTYRASKIAQKTAYRVPYKIGKGGGISSDKGQSKKVMPIELTYMHLRLIADYINVPLSILIMYTHLISLERRFKNRIDERNKKLEQLLSRVEFFASEMRRRIRENPNQDNIFTDLYEDADTGGIEYLANLKILKEAIDAFPRARDDADEK